VHIHAQTVVSDPSDGYANRLRIRDSEQGERGGNGFVNRGPGVFDSLRRLHALSNLIETPVEGLGKEPEAGAIIGVWL
jgi:hypothetical protein